MTRGAATHQHDPPVEHEADPGGNNLDPNAQQRVLDSESVVGPLKTPPDESRSKRARYCAGAGRRGWVELAHHRWGMEWLTVDLAPSRHQHRDVCVPHPPGQTAVTGPCEHARVARTEGKGGQREQSSCTGRKEGRGNRAVARRAEGTEQLHRAGRTHGGAGERDMEERVRVLDRVRLVVYRLRRRRLRRRLLARNQRAGLPGSVAALQRNARGRTDANCGAFVATTLWCSVLRGGCVVMRQAACGGCVRAV